jgi:hypothetical protein
MKLLPKDTTVIVAFHFMIWWWIPAFVLAIAFAIAAARSSWQAMVGAIVIFAMVKWLSTAVCALEVRRIRRKGDRMGPF